VASVSVKLNIDIERGGEDIDLIHPERLTHR
jgi:hypothetical protein